MRQEYGLNDLLENNRCKHTVKGLADLLIEDLQNCCCRIYGQNEQDKKVLLAELSLKADSLDYDAFDQRIDLIVCGEIVSEQYVPLTYQLQGDKFGFYGRCSVIAKVCGVDLYLNKSYSCKQGNFVWQNFSVSVKKLLKQLSWG